MGLIDKDINYWKETIINKYSPVSPSSQKGSTASRNEDLVGKKFNDYPSTKVICWPYIPGANDYHWAVYLKNLWCEQAGLGGQLQLWDNKNELIENVYSRGCQNSITGKFDLYYVKGSHFEFDCRYDI
jgi:hypothetical protein